MTRSAMAGTLLRSVSLVLAAWLLVVVSLEVDGGWRHVVPAVIWGLFLGGMAIRYGEKK